MTTSKTDEFLTFSSFRVATDGFWWGPCFTISHLSSTLGSGFYKLIFRNFLSIQWSGIISLLRQISGDEFISKQSVNTGFFTSFVSAPYVCVTPSILSPLSSECVLYILGFKRKDRFFLSIKQTPTCE